MPECSSYIPLTGNNRFFCVFLRLRPFSVISVQRFCDFVSNPIPLCNKIREIRQGQRWTKGGSYVILNAESENDAHFLPAVASFLENKVFFAGKRIFERNDIFSTEVMITG